MAKVSSGIRLSDEARQAADREAENLGISRTAVIEMAVRAFCSNAQRDREERNARGAALLGQALPAGHPQ